MDASTTAVRSSVPSAVRLSSGSNTVDAKDKYERMVLVRYFLDRPGYDLSNSSSRLWVNPPESTTPHDISAFLDEQGIKLFNDTTLLVELFLDQYSSFMLLEECATHAIHFDFTSTSSHQPGILNIRLTDLNEMLSPHGDSAKSSMAHSHPTNVPRCNTSPVGLFAFAMTVGLDALNVLRELLDDNSKIDGSYLLIYSPYAFWVSGFLQLIVGINEISRNNIYGATAFLGFGCFWLSNGTALIFTTYFPEQIPDIYRFSTSNNAPDTFVREMFIMLFACALFKQTTYCPK